MRRRIILTAVLMILTIAVLGAVEITFIIPTAFVPRALDAYTVLAGRQIEIMVYGSDDFHGSWSYSYAPQDPNETSKQFVKRAISEGIRAMVRLKEYSEDRERYSNEIGAIVPPDVNVPDGIVE